MTVALAYAFGMARAVPAVEVPSGQQIALHDVLVDHVGAEVWVRFRFLAPQIARSGGGISFAQAEGDLEHLCRQIAIPYLAEYDLAADVVSVTLFDRPVDFGVSDPDATQFIELFRVTSGSCVWEGL